MWCTRRRCVMRVNVMIFEQMPRPNIMRMAHHISCVLKNKSTVLDFDPDGR